MDLALVGSCGHLQEDSPLSRVHRHKTHLGSEKQWDSHLNEPAVCGEVHLYDEAGDVLAVADTVEGGALG